MKGKVVLVTGGSRGIGAEMARAFAREGASVAVGYHRSRKAADAVAVECGGVAVRGHVGRDADAIVGRVLERYGRLDVLVNNAGAADPRGWTADLDRITDELWDEVLDTDLRGTFKCSRAAARVMRRGKIINVASIPALVGDGDGLLYATAKAGVVGLTKSLAVRLAPRIQVNCVALGSVVTGWVGWLKPAQIRSYLSAIPLRRFGMPEEVAELAVFLAGNDYVTGQTYVLDGGEGRV